jgi:hypothetical protein
MVTKRRKMDAKKLLESFSPYLSPCQPNEIRKREENFSFVSSHFLFREGGEEEGMKEKRVGRGG